MIFDILDSRNIIYSSCVFINFLSFQIAYKKKMDPREIIVLSSGDEMSIEPYQAPSDESDARNRAFPEPVDMSLGSDDLQGGKDFAFWTILHFNVLFIIFINKRTPLPCCRS